MAKWRDGFPERPCVDSIPCPRPGFPGQWLPPEESSHPVLVELDGGTGVSIDQACESGDSGPFWKTYGNRVCGWMPLPKTRAQLGVKP